MKTIYNEDTIYYEELCPDAIKAIKKADSMVFIHSHQQSQFNSPFFLRLIMMKKIAKGYREERRIEIQLSGNIREYDKSHNKDYSRTACFGHLKSYYFERAPLVEFLRKGDKLHVEFCSGIQNEYMKEKDLVECNCSVYLKRGAKNIRFFIDRSLTPCQNLAKVVMHNHWNEY